MATFRVGQKVRYVGGKASRGHRSTGDHFVGSEVVIVRRADTTWDWVVKGDVLRDGVVRGGSLAPDEIQCDSCQLAPLTDPRAESFVADMERFALLAAKPARIPDELLAHIKGGA